MFAEEHIPDWLNIDKELIKKKKGGINIFKSEEQFESIIIASLEKKLFEKLPYVNVEILPLIDRTYCYTNQKRKYWIIIYLGGLYLSLFECKYSFLYDKLITGKFNHELKHLIEQDKEYYARVYDHLQNLINKTNVDNQENFMLDIKYIEYFISTFFYLTLVEGSAMFVELYENDKLSLTSNIFESIYSDALSTVQRLNIDFDNYIHLLINQTKIFINKHHLKQYYYTIGLHMVYTIIYANIAELYDIIEMNLPTFIKAYETAIKSLNKDPIITLKGRECNGFHFDYTDALLKIDKLKKNKIY
ncbi:MAG: hypothetical protein V1859_09650 [archaeon]